MKKFRRKPSAYQKQIRFLTVLSIVVGIGVVVVILLLVNHSAYQIH